MGNGQRSTFPGSRHGALGSANASVCVCVRVQKKQRQSAPAVAEEDRPQDKKEKSAEAEDAESGMEVFCLGWDFVGVFIFKVLSDFEHFNVDDPESVCVCVHPKRILGNCLSHHRQSWHSDCLRHENASRVNYIDLDLHSRSHKSLSR